MNKPNPFLRILGIVLLSLSALFTLLGGAGSSCIAFAAEKFGPKWEPFIAIKPIFQVLVIVSLAAAAYGVYALVRLIKGKRSAYFQSLAFLLVGGAASAVQYYFSLELRGKTAPNSMRLYITVLTLVVLLIMRIPGIWERTGFGGKEGDAGSTRAGGGLALILCGLITLTCPLWAAPTHVIDGFNTANVLLWPLLGGGALLLLAGGLLLAPRLAPQLATESARS